MFRGKWCDFWLPAANYRMEGGEREKKGLSLLRAHLRPVLSVHNGGLTHPAAQGKETKKTQKALIDVFGARRRKTGIGQVYNISRGTKIGLYFDGQFLYFLLPVDK